MSELDLTPGLGVPLGGNVRADAANRGVHDRLVGVVLLLQDGEQTDVLVGTDLVAVPRAVSAAIEQAVAAGAGVPADRVVVHATHTHSGPDTTGGLGFVEVDQAAVDDWLVQVLPRFTQAAASALADARPAVLRRGTAQVEGAAHNRRVRQLDGTVRMNWEPAAAEGADGTTGPVDPELTVLELVGADDGEPIGALVHYALHPAILAGLDWLVSADYVAQVRELVGARLGGRPVLYASGALGDVNHIDHRGSAPRTGFDVAAGVGRVVGAAAERALWVATEVEAQVRGWSFTVTLDQRTVDRERLAAARRTVAAHAGVVLDAFDGIPAPAYARWTLSRGRRLAPLLDVHVRVLELGPVVLVGLPFEVFVELGLALRDVLPGRVVKVVSLVGDYLGYLPTAEAFDLGGYEPTFGTSTVVQGQAEVLVAQIARTLVNRHQEAS